MVQTPRTEFAQALKAISTERGLDADVILETIKQAIVAAYKRDVKETEGEEEEIEYDVELNSVSGEAKIFAWPEGKPKEKKDVTPPGFGRIAAQTAKQVIHQRIREAEKDSIMDEFSGRVGTLISGMILRFDGPDVRIDLGRSEGVMPASERAPNERLSANQRLTFLMKDIVETPKGKQIILSRADPEFVKKLFAREVPEVSSGSVEIKAIAREAGTRTKIAVLSTQSGVDPVGSCVGQKGIRVQAATNELGGERIDIIPWSDKTEELIEAALSPAEGLSVTLNKKEETAQVEAPEDQLSLAIGKDGQNVRLASKLTGWRIEIEHYAGVKKTIKRKKTKVKKTKTKKIVKKDEDIDSQEKEVKTKQVGKKKKVASKKS
ncbi:transcription termination factor NusA [Patescibacteria group bacterium]|nr:transcription termination factor NusA [Patescibacteria group bacterium]MBU0776765.1 transcription termination factor NusA [Patescibacteria group bacterium]MBU0846338.1 transcription termination factor NusA [Patescibacteria group bacterium]MBU0922702.1 transcription termination factor NusA [Patescibacteria group bacterium]MBU1066753.1 transcription termination factor NusA [Patescibacteria group bacterium]